MNGWRPPASEPLRRRRQIGDLDAYRRRLTAFQQGFAQSFGYEMADPYGEICAKLAAGTPFSYSRFGDGEFKAVFGAEGVNCDGHRFFPDLGQRLTEILESKPGYMLGLLPQAVRVHGVEPILALSDGIRWVLANSLHLALLEGRIDPLFEALAGRNVLLVGPEHLREFAAARNWAYVPVASRDCWLGHAGVLDELCASLSDSGDVVLLCASMMSNVLIDDLYRDSPAHTYLDVGSVFDPFSGLNSRAYHDALDLSVLSESGGQR